MTPPKDFFTASDFHNKGFIQLLLGGAKAIECAHAAEVANALIRERSRVVYAHSEAEQRRLDHYEWKEYPNFLGAERRALLFNIEPIAAPDSAESLLREIIDAYNKKSPPGSLYTYQIISSACDGEIIERARKLLERKDGG